jgi:hypothetical protein
MAEKSGTTRRRRGIKDPPRKQALKDHEWETASAMSDLCNRCGLRRELTNDSDHPFIYHPPTTTSLDIRIGTFKGWTDPGGCPWWGVPGAYRG